MAKKKGKSKATKQSGGVKSASLTDTINDEVIAEALSSVNQPVLMKVCRLCQAKDGPFLNIFDAEKITAKKIDDLMPFVIAENDELPHKICFRCSAKVEELHEFVQKCMKTQESLRIALGKIGPLMTKTKVRTQWEEKLNKSNMSNDDICNALIKKAMEGIKNVPLNSLPVEEEKPLPPLSKKMKTDVKSVEQDVPDVSIKQVKLAIEKCDSKAITRTFRTNHSDTLPDGIDSKVTKQQINKSNNISQSKDSPVEAKPANNIQTKQTMKPKVSNDESFDACVKISKDDKSKIEVPSKVSEPPLFNIMEHVSTIKVNGVGVLFQCKLCNRNFLKKEVVEVHGCAKNVIPKVDFTKKLLPPEPPKALNTVKYIKIDSESKKKINTSNKNCILRPDQEIKKVISSECNSKLNTNTETVNPEVKPKQKVGPASKTRRVINSSKPETSLSQREHSPRPATINTPESNPSNPLIPTVNFPIIPSLNSRYKLVPGPNNTFSLVEESAASSNVGNVEEKPPHQKAGKKRNYPEQDQKSVHNKSKDRKLNSDELKSKAKLASLEIIDLEDHTNPTLPSEQKPYPVGLFQTSRHSSMYVPPDASKPSALTTPAMKKQSYTVLQTGNPSKLVISAKPQHPVEEVKKKRNRKKVDIIEETPKEPFNVTIEDTAPPKDAGFFTFINVDPLLQPSYVLPTDNIIQESQITTSTPVGTANTETKDKDKYSCNMCGEIFSREKKLLTHIQSHYAKMDEEDQMRAEKDTTKKRGRKS